MAVNRLATYNVLADTYTQEIIKASDEITALDVKIAALRLELAGYEQEREAKVTVRRNTASQLRGVNALIRGMEDANLAEDRKRYDDELSQY